MYIFQKEGYEEPRPLLKGSLASSSFVVNTAYKKLIMGVPFYRQEKDLNHNGIPVSRQVLCNWFMRSAEKYLKPVFDRMETDMRKADILNNVIKLSTDDHWQSLQKTLKPGMEQSFNQIVIPGLFF